MATTGSNQTAMTANIDLVVDQAKLRREINNAAGVVGQGMRQAETNGRRAIADTVIRVSSQFKEAADKLNAVLNVPLKLGTAFGGAGIGAFLKSSTAEAQQFKARLAEVQTALGRVGEKLAYSVKFGDKNMYQWAEKLAHYLNNLSTDQLQKAADIITKIAVTVGTLKTVGLGLDLFKSVGGGSLVGAGAQLAGAGARLAGGVGTGVGAGVGTGVGLGVGSAALRGARAAAAAARARARADAAVSALRATAIRAAAGDAAGAAAALGRVGVAGDVGARTAAAGAAAAKGGSLALMTAPVGGAGALSLAGILTVLGTTETMRRTYGKKQHGYNVGYGEMWDAVKKHGLSYNFPTHITADPYEGPSREEMRRVVLARAQRGEGRGNLYGRYSQFGAGNQERNIRWAREDASNSVAENFTIASKRKPELEKVLAEADTLAFEFKKLRDGFKVGEAAYDAYNKAYVDNIQQAIAARAELTRIEKLGADEKKSRIEADKAIARLRADYKEDDNERNDARVDAREQMNKHGRDLKERLEELKKGRPSMSLGISAAQMPEFRAYQMKDVMDAKDEYAKATAETLERIEELEIERRKRQAEWDKTEERRKKALDESIQRIEEAVTGQTAGSPVQ